MLAPKLGLADLNETQTSVLIHLIGEVSRQISNDYPRSLLVEARSDELAQQSWLLMLRGQHGGVIVLDDGSKEKNHHLVELFTRAIDVAAHVAGGGCPKRCKHRSRFKTTLAQRLQGTLRKPASHLSWQHTPVTRDDEDAEPVELLELTEAEETNGWETLAPYSTDDLARLAPAICDVTHFLDRCRWSPCRPVRTSDSGHPIKTRCPHRISGPMAATLASDIRRAWDRTDVSEARRQAFFLHHVMDLTQAEAGRILGKSGTAVGKAANECAEKMAEFLNRSQTRDELAERRERKFSGEGSDSAVAA